MVSLRSGSTTDQQEAEGQPEISSKRKASRQRMKANNLNAALPPPTSSSGQTNGLEGPYARHRAALPIIAEASPGKNTSIRCCCIVLGASFLRDSPQSLAFVAGTVHMTEEEEFEAVEREAEAVAEQALHSSQKAVDTPARNTRAKNRLLALPVPLVAGESPFQCCR